MPHFDAPSFTFMLREQGLHAVMAYLASDPTLAELEALQTQNQIESVAIAAAIRQLMTRNFRDLEALVVRDDDYSRGQYKDLSHTFCDVMESAVRAHRAAMAASRNSNPAAYLRDLSVSHVVRAVLRVAPHLPNGLAASLAGWSVNQLAAVQRSA